jgi:hypothetical protein
MKQNVKCKLIIVGFVFLAIQSFGQDSTKFFFDEFKLSANRTMLSDYNTKDRYGFGIGLYHSFFQKKTSNIMFGLEYNLTRQFKKQMYEAHFANSSNVTYTINSISIPVGLRINIGKEIKYFAEIGGFVDLTISSNRKGTMTTNNPLDSLNRPYNYSFNENAKLTNTYGVYLGLGVRIPISKYELIIAPDYKLGLHQLDSYYDITNSYFRINVGLKI